MKRVLLVEDNDGDILLIKDVLEDLAFEVELTICNDGESALKELEKMELEQRLPLFLIMDINIPRKNGLAVLQQIKQHHNLKLLPVVMFSSSPAPLDIEYAYREYANCYITKPLEAQDFIHCIQMVFTFWTQVASLPKN